MTCEALSSMQLKLGPFMDNLITRHNTLYGHGAAPYHRLHCSELTCAVLEFEQMQPCEAGSDTCVVLLQ